MDPRVAKAQPPARVYRVGFVFSVTPPAELLGAEPVNFIARGFVHGMRSRGYVLGGNLAVEWRSAEGRPERHGEILRDLVRMNVDAIVVANDTVAVEAKRTTTTIPIVLWISQDPVGRGLVASLARPGGNVTGLMATSVPEMTGKQLQLLKEAAPKVSRVVFLARKIQWDGDVGHALRAAAKSLDVTIRYVDSQSGDIPDVLTLVAEQRPDALLVGPAPELLANTERVAGFALRNRLPAIQYAREFADAGGLMSYGVNLVELIRRAGGYVDRIFKGARPGDLPVEQAETFDFLINLKTAKALGLTIPPSLLLRASQVLE